MNAGNWISLGSFVAAAVSAVVAVVQAKRASASKGAAEHHEASAEHNAERATKAAEEAAAWQRQAAGAAQRAADALEKQNQMAEQLVQAAEEVPWRLEHKSGAIWRLRNITDYPKFEVTIAGPGVSKNRGPGVIDRIDGQGSEEFWGNTFWGSELRATVTWHSREDAQDEPRSWTDMMPPGD